MNNQEKKNQIVIYKAKDGEAMIEVRMNNETVWLSQRQMAELFDKDVRTVSEHVRNIYKEGELEEKSTIKAKSGNSGIGLVKPTKYYNLDVIISVGYRVKSQRGTHFRIWATKILKQHLIKGYTLNEKRLLEARNKFYELQEAVLFLQKQSRKELLKGQEAEILNLLADYSKTFSLLEKYDSGSLEEKKGKKTGFVLRYDECAKIIAGLKKELFDKKEAGNLFGQERKGIFEGVIGGLYQTFKRKELYPSIEDKSSHLLYLTIKDHPFIDGNKRSAAFLLVYFLDRSDHLFKKSGERKINDNALTALALLIAESSPKDKDVMIKIIKNLISE